MRKTILLALAAVVGSVLGVLVFMGSHFHFEYGPLTLLGVGAICGVVIGWAACVRINRPRKYAPTPSAIPPADVTVQSPKKSRPLTWMYRPHPRDGARTRSS
jgi:hypothetical protein